MLLWFHWSTWAVTAYLVSEWIIRLVMLVYVPQKRSPAAARSWLLLIFVWPWLGLVLYAAFGRAYLSERRLRAQARFSELVRATGKDFFTTYAARPELAPQFQQAVVLAHNLGDFPILRGNEVELLTDYQGAINRLLGDIAAAKNHVHLLYYIFADDETGRRVLAALAEAVKRGVVCRVLLDSLGSKRSRRRLVPDMLKADIEAVEMLPLRWYRRHRTRMDLRNHRKIAVIDGAIGYVGSQNLVNADFKAGITYEELVARVTGPVVAQLQAVFLADRYCESTQPLQEPEHFPEPASLGTVAAQVLPSGPSYPFANNQRLIVSLVHAAQKRVVITTPYVIPDVALLQALQTAVLRGADVHLVVSRKADQFLVGLAQRSYYDDLLQAGVIIHRYHERFLHAKHMSVDDAICLIGSSNMDIRSFQLNAEISLLVYDAGVAGKLRTVQERYFAGADVLTLAEWEQRPFLTK